MPERAAGLTVRGQAVDISVVPLKKGLPDFSLHADMAELADALGSGPSDRKVVEVRVLLSAPKSVVGGQWLVATPPAALPVPQLRKLSTNH